MDLTRSEFDLLYELLRADGAVLSRADLIHAVRGNLYSGNTWVGDADERAIEVHIGNLRRKLQDDHESPRWLQTVRGAGYRLARPRRADRPA
ncbi:helix-turn-helix domain-containing protein [Arthrobacter sp. 9E06]|uniref:winged helix-turn-helix domain-containing protein n=1 Tax=Arthrobacter sp. 9E06 TaxID=2058890 RepID=UPI0028006E91|nr:helix-turn-helix domain-containing protein [Arthrobacter sp. 9E06]